MLRDRRLFRNKKSRSAASSVSSASSTTSSSVKFARLPHGKDEPEQETSLLCKSSGTGSSVETQDKENFGYDFRSIMTAGDDEEEEILFAHLTERQPNNETTTLASNLITPPRCMNSSAATTAASTSSDQPTAAADLDQDMAKAFALVGLVLDSYPDLRQQYLARYKTKDDTIVPSKSNAPHDVTAASAAPPLHVWLLLVGIMGILLALDGLVARVTTLLSILSGAK